MSTLRNRLIWAFVALVALLGLLHVVSTWLTTEAYTREVQQQLNLELAKQIVAEKLLLSDGEVKREALNDVFQMMMVINPSIELYLLDPKGQILAYSAPEGRVKLARVDLEPVQRYLGGPIEAPILGDNPRAPGQRKAFSAAPIPATGPPDGYLYIVLGGDLYDSAVGRLRKSHILRVSLWTGFAGLLLALLLGSWLFGHLTRRLHRLGERVESFRAEELGDGDNAVGGEDEIARLEATFDRLGERLREYLQEREQLHRERRELISNVSHDLRTPITALRGYLETLQLKGETLAPEESQHYLNVALRHAERLGRLVSELFELTRLDSADPELHPEPLSLAELAQDNTQRFRLPAEQRGLVLRCLAEESTPFVVADIRLLERALVNLLENALRFTAPGGEVTVKVDVDQDRVQLSVSDTGCGISAEQLPRVFDRYYRAQPGEDSGTGLGLAITRRILELHQSAVEVESRVGEGSTFRFSLPVAGPPASLNAS